MLKTPDITTAQITAALAWVASQAVAFGWITNGTAQLAVSITGTLVAVAWKIADAVIRNGRAKAQGQVLAAESTASLMKPDPAYGGNLEDPPQPPRTALTQ